jgi:hypothetical protein
MGRPKKIQPPKPSQQQLTEKPVEAPKASPSPSVDPKADPNMPAGTELQYGYAVPIGRSKAWQARFELACYAANRTVEQGGLGAHQHFVNAWRLIWPKFEWNHWADLMVEGWCNYGRVSIMGHAAAGKTFVHSRIALLDWLAAPDKTMTSLATVTAEGLRLRMWGDLMRAVEELPREFQALIKVYNSTNRMAVMVANGGGGSDKYIIEGMAVSRDKNSVGKIRGKHAPRRRVILDEADDMNQAIYDAFGNIMTDPDVKIVDMSNATDKLSNYGKACTPLHGWENVSPEDLFWATKDKGICLHFDGLQNPNIKAGPQKDDKDKYAYMLGASRMETIKKQFGEDSREWWCMVRGFFPPEGMVSRVFPASVIEKGKPGFVWDQKPVYCATLDPAFEHDDCVLHIGELGWRRNAKRGISGVKSIKIVAKESTNTEPKDYQIAHEVMRICGEFGITPAHFIMDKSGNGRGVFAMLQKEWSMEVQGINYGGEATERVFRVGETDKANAVVRYFVSELWFRARYAIEDGILAGLGQLDEQTIDDLHSRRYDKRQYSAGPLMVVESKDELKKRLGRSPDYGDAFVQFAELLCRLEGISVSAAKDPLKEVRTIWHRQMDQAKRSQKIYSEEVIDV